LLVRRKNFLSPEAFLKRVVVMKKLLILFVLLGFVTPSIAQQLPVLRTGPCTVAVPASVDNTIECFADQCLGRLIIWLEQSSCKDENALVCFVQPYPHGFLMRPMRIWVPGGYGPCDGYACVVGPPIPVGAGLGLTCGPAVLPPPPVPPVPPTVPGQGDV